MRIVLRGGLSSKAFFIRPASKASPALSKVTVVILKSASFGANLNEGHEQHSKHEGQNEKGTRHDYTGGICPDDSCL